MVNCCFTIFIIRSDWETKGTQGSHVEVGLALPKPFTANQVDVWTYLTAAIWRKLPAPPSTLFFAFSVIHPQIVNTNVRSVNSKHCCST